MTFLRRMLVPIMCLCIVCAIQPAQASVCQHKEDPDADSTKLYAKDILGFTPTSPLADVASKSDRDARCMAYIDTIKARSMLAGYDKMYALFKQDPEKYSDHASELTLIRGEILETALGAYLWGGPGVYPQGCKELLDALYKRAEDGKNLRNPADLHELVKWGILPHLPASPYPHEQYTDQLPSFPVQPGLVYYKPYATEGKRGYVLKAPGQLEFAVLLIFDEVKYEIDPDDLESEYIGDLKAVLPDVSRGVSYIWGMYFPPSKYNKEPKPLEHKQ